MSLARIDETRHGLLPWMYEEHRQYVLKQYGSLLASNENKEVAKKYVQKYQQKEREDDAAYERQREELRISSVSVGAKPQELPNKEKIDWLPKGFGKKEEKVDEEKEDSVEVVEEKDVKEVKEVAKSSKTKSKKK